MRDRAGTRHKTGDGRAGFDIDAGLAFERPADAGIIDEPPREHLFRLLLIVGEWRRIDADGGESTPFRIDMMRRERGFGDAYGAARTGEWEYVRYRPDGSQLVPPHQSGWCSSCHQKAGKERDWVYRGRF